MSHDIEGLEPEPKPRRRIWWRRILLAVVCAVVLVLVLAGVDKQLARSQARDRTASYLMCQRSNAHRSAEEAALVCLWLLYPDGIPHRRSATPQANYM